MAIENHNYCIEPEDDLTIWRYLDLQKIEEMLAHNALFFCRADIFSDPYEGSIPKREAENRMPESEKIANSQNRKFDSEKALNGIEGISNTHKLYQKKYIINCWHINPNENDAMWRLYLKDNEGVVIKSTVKNLKQSFLENSERILISKVRYLDYEVGCWFHPIEFPNTGYSVFTPIVHKRIEFNHEKELRLIHEIDCHNIDQFWTEQENYKGLNINVNLNLLINEIYVSPNADKNHEKYIIDLLQKYGYNFTVLRSKMINVPYF